MAVLGYLPKLKRGLGKPQHLTYFDNLKKKQQDQGSKSWQYTESFMSLTISNLRTTAFYFENK